MSPRLVGVHLGIITNVEIADSVTTIADYAFQGNQLISVEIPDVSQKLACILNNQLTSVRFRGVTTIEVDAFRENQLTSVEIPDSVTYLSGFGGNQLKALRSQMSPPLANMHLGSDCQCCYSRKCHYDWR